jgi:NitT/TauT family transport system ATP-binding protein
MSTLLLEMAEAHVSFRGTALGGRLRVLDGISLTIPPGQFLTILGPSGCGKSTLLRVMAGLLAPERGLVRWGDGLQENRASRMAINFQRPVLLPWLSVSENALLPLRLTTESHPADSEPARERLERLLHMTGLYPFRHALPQELSGGMQMRAALVRTLIAEPELIFMDEPFSAIDELTRQDLGREFLSMVRETRAATVFVTHSIQEAAMLSDRIVILSPRPSRVVDDIMVEYDVPRRHHLIFRHRAFLDLCDHLRGVMAHG